MDIGVSGRGIAAVAEPAARGRDAWQAGILRLCVGLLRRLSPIAASNLGGFVARTVGPWLPVSRVALDNLAFAMPELGAAARRRVLRGVWDNLGRTAAELPHLRSLRRTAGGPGWECDDDATLLALKSGEGPAILFTGHLGNWEIGFPVAAAFGWTFRGSTARRRMRRSTR